MTSPIQAQDRIFHAARKVVSCSPSELVTCIDELEAALAAYDQLLDSIFHALQTVDVDAEATDGASS